MMLSYFERIFWTLIITPILSSISEIRFTASRCTLVVTSTIPREASFSLALAINFSRDILILRLSWTAVKRTV